MPGWNERIARARELARQNAATAEILLFYAGVAEFQQTVAGTRPHRDPGAAPFLDQVDLDTASSVVPSFLGWLQRKAPERLARAAAEMKGVDDVAWRGRLREYLAATRDADRPVGEDPLDFVLEAVLQPFAEAVAVERRAEERTRELGSRAGRCPICDSRPGIGVLREEGNGARRALLCGLCLTEWDYVRTRCPACDEHRSDSLPVYTTDTFELARVESCESCRRYLKTIDLSKNALAVPIVDDLASLPLDLWAREQGYQRIRPNLLRV